MVWGQASVVETGGAKFGYDFVLTDAMGDGRRGAEGEPDVPTDTESDVQDAFDVLEESEPGISEQRESVLQFMVWAGSLPPDAHMEWMREFEERCGDAASVRKRQLRQRQRSNSTNR